MIHCLGLCCRHTLPHWSDVISLSIFCNNTSWNGGVLQWFPWENDMSDLFGKMTSDFFGKMTCLTYLGKWHVWLIWENDMSDLFGKMTCLISLGKWHVWLLWENDMSDFFGKMTCLTYLGKCHVWLLWENDMSDFFGKMTCLISLGKWHVWLLWESDMSDFIHVIQLWNILHVTSERLNCNQISRCHSDSNIASELSCHITADDLKTFKCET